MEESMKVSLSREDVICQTNWVGGFNLIATSLR